MTVAPDAPRLTFDGLSGAIAALRDRGLRLSTPRRLVLQALFAADGPASAAHLAHTLAIEESSVYRNLEVLEELGLVRHVHLGHGPGLYALTDRDEVEYLYCNRCAKVTAVSPDRLDAVRREIRHQFGYEASFTHFAIVGLCERCAAQSRAGALTDTVEEPVRHRHDREPGVTGHPTDGPTHAHSHGGFVHSHPAPPARGPAREAG